MEGKEISTTAIVKDALSRNKQVFVPYIHKVQGHERTSIMDMLALDSLEDFRSLQLDNWGIPSLSKASVPNRENVLGGKGLSSGDESKVKDSLAFDLIIVPAVAFDHQLNRLGHGKGYYDSFFSRCHNLVRNGFLCEMPILGQSCAVLSSSLVLMPLLLTAYQLVLRWTGN
jgi:5-formyltetrahydrofolate cyclo-ligase